MRRKLLFGIHPNSRFSTELRERKSKKIDYVAHCEVSNFLLQASFVRENYSTYTPSAVANLLEMAAVRVARAEFSARTRGRIR
jgi:hypothetical protein